jgi:flagellar basal body P-ring formation protein FlgA
VRVFLLVTRSFRAPKLAGMFRLLLTICTLLLLAAAPLATLQAMPPNAPDLLRYVQEQAAARISADGARIEVAIGQLNPRLQLAPCARIEPFIPASSRLWGRGHVGLRCAEGATWSVQVPVTVRVHGPALVTTRPLTSNTPLSPEDFSIAEVEWTRESQGVVTDASQLDNRVLTRPIGVGQPVPLIALRAPQVIAAGDPVKVQGQGRGFAVSAEAVALSGAQDGQLVRVRTDAGRILTGTARAGRRVEITF